MIQAELRTLLADYPVVTLMGPRQAGKTTLTQMMLPEYRYINLEDPSQRAVAIEEPLALLNIGTTLS
jgi:predicted AAA+ superfamily ATPase